MYLSLKGVRKQPQLHLHIYRHTQIHTHKKHKHTVASALQLIRLNHQHMLYRLHLNTQLDPAMA
jgi:hypothetical protein